MNGAIVGYINADDEIAPGAVAAIVDAFRREPRAGWLCGKVEYIAPGGEVLGRMQPVRVSLASYAGIGWSTIPQQTVWARREFFDAIGPFDLAFRNCGDYDWCTRALTRQHPLIPNRTLGRSACTRRRYRWTPRRWSARAGWCRSATAAPEPCAGCRASR